MKKKVIIAVILFVLSGLFILGILISFFRLSDISFSGASGLIGLTILQRPGVTIHNPENITYNFSVAEYLSDNMIIDLNVSDNFGADVWWYILEDVKWDLDSGSIGFAPNSSIDTYRRSNRLTVFALNSTSGLERNASVDFFISVPNSSPLLGQIDNEIIVCEGGQLNYVFNATDIDEDNLNFDITPKDPFFLAGVNNPTLEIIAPKLTYAESAIISVPLTKEHSGRNGWTVYSENISVGDDGDPSYSDYKIVNITVVEVNNAPLAWIDNDAIEVGGGGQNLFFEINVSDIEDGNQESGNLSYNVTFLSGNKFFDINNFGEFNFTPSNSLIGEHEIESCVTDRALDLFHQNISLCGTGDNQSACLFFNITITGEQVIISSGGGGGGGGGSSPKIEKCETEWVCYDWSQCRNAKLSLELGTLIGEEFRAIDDECLRKRLSGEGCGFQERSCFDINACTGKEGKGKPIERQTCQFTLEPSCSDGIKNCHDGGCEFLIDCGGPCSACPTCSDEIQNQGEYKADCGGPCPRQCTEEIPAGSVTIYLILGAVITTILIILIIRIRVFLRMGEGVENRKS